MSRTTLFSAIALAAAALAALPDAEARRAPPGHRFIGSVEAQVRSNDNVAIARSSGERFDFVDRDEFGREDDEEEGGDEADFEDDDGFDDLLDLDFSEEDLAIDDALDADGDGIDDLLDPDAVDRVDSESRFTAKLALGHRYTFGDGRTTWTNGLRLSADRHAQRDDLDKFNWAATTGLGFASNDGRHAFRPGLSYVVLDKRVAGKFSSTAVVSLDYSYRASRRTSLGVTYNYQDKDITSPAAPDARIDTLSFNASFAASRNDIIKIEFAPKVEDSTQVTRNTDAWGWELAYTRRLPWDMTAGVGVRFDSVDYKNLVPGRKDDHRVIGAQLARSFGRRFVAELGLESSERNSNLPGRDARNDSVYLGGTWKF